jgi:chromosomal replication initiator protein
MTERPLRPVIEGAQYRGCGVPDRSGESAHKSSTACGKALTTLFVAKCGEAAAVPIPEATQPGLPLLGSRGSGGFRNVVEHNLYSAGRARAHLEGDRNLEETWDRIREHLHATFSDSFYETWFSTLRPVEVRQNSLVVEAPPRTRDWIRRRFGSVLAAAVAAAHPSLRHVELVDKGEHPGVVRHGRAGRRSEELPSMPLSHSFGTFVIGAGNRFAHAAALAVAEMPGQAYNPLILYGPPGIGKTHLLQAIGSYVGGHDPGASIHYATVETFTNNFTSALRTDTIHSFKRTYRQCDLLLLDDVQFLDGKTRTSEEFFQTLDCATTAGVQVVLTVDRHPSKLPSLESRLRERLQGGLAVDIHLPDQPTRIAILRKLTAANPALQLDAEVLNSLASGIGSNVRVLAGALTRLTAYASLTGSKVTLSLVEELLTNLYGAGGEHQPQQRRAQPTVSQIQRKTASALELEPAPVS